MHSAEILFTLLTVLKDIADTDVHMLGSQFSSNILEATERIKIKLVALQAESPNTFKVIHTLLAFKATTAEFRHRLHTYQDQGFFDDKLVAQAQYVLQEREQEVEQYLALDFFQSVAGLLSINFCNQDHPVVATFRLDQQGIQGGYASSSASSTDKQQNDQET